MTMFTTSVRACKSFTPILSGDRHINNWRSPENLYGDRPPDKTFSFVGATTFHNTSVPVFIFQMHLILIITISFYPWSVCDWHFYEKSQSNTCSKQFSICIIYVFYIHLSNSVVLYYRFLKTLKRKWLKLINFHGLFLGIAFKNHQNLLFHHIKKVYVISGVSKSHLSSSLLFKC